MNEMCAEEGDVLLLWAMTFLRQLEYGRTGRYVKVTCDSAAEP